MGLSEDENLLLQQIEESLYSDDPHLARAFTRVHGADVVDARRLLIGVLLVVAGLLIVVGAGVTAGIALVGVLGFLTMLGGSFMAYRAAIPWLHRRMNPLSSHTPNN